MSIFKYKREIDHYLINIIYKPLMIPDDEKNSFTPVAQPFHDFLPK
jgi:hypothetical protein